MKKRLKWMVYIGISIAILSGNFQAGTSLWGINTSYAQEKQDRKQNIPQYTWRFKGFLGGYDLASVQRGYLVYRDSCASCHSIKEMRYADLQQAGLTLEQIEKIAAKDHVLDGKDLQGKDHYRPATVKDFFPAPYFNEQIAKANNSGQYPVDFSRYMMTGSNRENYMMALLTGYQEAPKGFKPEQSGMYYNLYAPDHQIAMRNPLTPNGIHYDDGTEASVAQQARDVVTFLSWAAHPHLIERHRIGVMAFLYMSFIAILAFLVKCAVWRKVR